MIVLDSALSFSLWWTMAIYTQKCEQNDWKLIMGRGEVGIKMSWVEKIKKLTIGGDDYSGLEGKRWELLQKN